MNLGKSGHCSICNSILDDFEINICNACIAEESKELSDDMEHLKKVLDKLEQDTKAETGVNKISGGFVIADMFDYDDNDFDIELRWGVQSDVDNRVHVEQYTVDRKTWEIE